MISLWYHVARRGPSTNGACLQDSASAKLYLRRTSSLLVLSTGNLCCLSNILSDNQNITSKLPDLLPIHTCMLLILQVWTPDEVLFIARKADFDFAINANGIIVGSNIFTLINS